MVLRSLGGFGVLGLGLFFPIWGCSCPPSQLKTPVCWPHCVRVKHYCAEFGVSCYTPLA